MKPWLQRFGFKESRYERPSQKWVCGWAAEGRPCPLGPDRHGHCHSTSECAPVRKGDRWFCARPAAAGGACPDGPKSDGGCGCPIARCTPLRSLRARRGLVTGFTVAFTFGALLVLLGGSGRWRFISPGRLTSHHAMSELTCADCHGTALTPGTNGAGFAATTGYANEDSHRCLACHQLGPEPFQPHGRPFTERVALTRKAQTPAGSVGPGALALSSLLFGGAPAHGNDLACATCHQEHHGKDHDLTRLSNAQCQSCHARRFDSFANGHPDFSQYPYLRRTRIFFDHVSHLEKHFQNAQFKTNAPSSCASCHETDSAGRTMVVKNFAATCADCHGKQIQGEGRADTPGIAVLRIPGLDVRTLTEKGMGPGDWPADAEGKLTPFMQVLLSTDAKTAEALTTLAKADLLDLLDAKPPELQAAEQLAWSVKELFFELVTKGQAALRDRLTLVVQRELAQAELSRLTGMLPMDALAAAQTEWFPNLLAEVPRHRESGKAAAQTPAPAATRGAVGQSAGSSSVKPVSPDNWMAHGGWYRSRNDYAILYRPTGHADQFLQAWLDLSGSAKASSPGAPLATIFRNLSPPKAPGVCTKCHSIDGVADGRWAINWQPARPVASQHRFTRFSHQPHFSLLDQTGCLTCHELDPKAAYPKSFEDNFSPANFTSNFAPLRKAVCSSCHSDQRAGDRCLKCHDYHIGSFTPTFSKRSGSRTLSPRPAASAATLEKN